MSLRERWPSDPELHGELVYLYARVPTRHGGYEVWACSCVCGWQGWKPAWDTRYFPAKVNARSAWRRHFRHSTGINLEVEKHLPVEEEYEQLTFGVE